MKKLSFISMVCLLMLLAACNSSDHASSNKNENSKKEEIKSDSGDEELENAKKMFEPLGDIPVPDDNPMTDEKVELGKKLFFDSRLSGNNKLSCMSCHSPGAGYGDGLATFIGFEGVKGKRNSPTIINSGYYEENFWDGRAGSLEEQALGPIESEVEMNQDLDELVAEINEVPQYVEEFDKVFNDKVTVDNIAKAIAAFERTIVVKDTDFDKYLLGDEAAITDEAKEGMKLFVGKASCISCHAGPLLSDHGYHNLGITGDDGRYEVTQKEEDKGAFRTPGLRGVAHTAPFMHDGSLETLRDVIEYYNEGGGDHPNKSSLIKPLQLTEEEIDALVAFLESMSCEVEKVETPEIP
ncbi:c-type cytochrome [Bacillus aquiflavi]|uniref:cytochrome-c peroxidase n=1 Tax=Bacillus aquiflavi TaxID=2672567 RepID=UPI001CA92F32|nr:cytochrome c peroxidase [Bacillus aquiflavi]UAC48904.1 c-type cytochrome [Bacillus aquiflavi]